MSQAERQLQLLLKDIRLKVTVCLITTLIAALARSNQNNYSKSTTKDSTLSEEHRVSYSQTFISIIDL